jgi:chromosome segregation ATPase
MSRALIERRLTELSDRLRDTRRELAVVDEQLEHLAGVADEARLRSLVSETPLADQEYRDASRHAEAMARHRASVTQTIQQLESAQDELLDRLTAGTD